MGILKTTKIQKADPIYVRLLIGLIISTMVYVLLNYLFTINVTTLSDPKRSLVQAISYILIPLIWYVFVIHREPFNASLRDFFATKNGSSKRNLFRGFVEGNLVYLLISLPLFLLAVVLYPETFWWFRQNRNPEFLIWLGYAIISVTSVEFVTKSYIMIPLLNRNKNKLIIFSLALLTWCLGHIIEFIWLSSYVPNYYAIIIVLEAGIFSIYVVLRSENIYGVWSGHILLNVFIVVFLNLNLV